MLELVGDLASECTAVDQLRVHEFLQRFFNVVAGQPRHGRQQIQTEPATDRGRELRDFLDGRQAVQARHQGILE